MLRFKINVAPIWGPTVDENITATIKIQNGNFFQYCDSNIGLFFIAPYSVIALTTLR